MLLCCLMLLLLLLHVMLLPSHQTCRVLHSVLRPMQLLCACLLALLFRVIARASDDYFSCILSQVSHWTGTAPAVTAPAGCLASQLEALPAAWNAAAAAAVLLSPRRAALLLQLRCHSRCCRLLLCPSFLFTPPPNRFHKTWGCHRGSVV